MGTAYPEKPGADKVGATSRELPKPPEKKPKSIKRKFVGFGLFEAELDRFLEKELAEVGGDPTIRVGSVHSALRASSGGLRRLRGAPCSGGN